MLNNKKQIKMTLDDLIKQTEDNIKYHLQRLAEEHTTSKNGESGLPAKL